MAPFDLGFFSVHPPKSPLCTDGLLFIQRCLLKTTKALALPRTMPKRALLRNVYSIEEIWMYFRRVIFRPHNGAYINFTERFLTKIIQHT
jgi:hypothetical protein